MDWKLIGLIDHIDAHIIWFSVGLIRELQRQFVGSKVYKAANKAEINKNFGQICHDMS